MSKEYGADRETPVGTPVVRADPAITGARAETACAFAPHHPAPLAAAGRPNVRVELDRLDARGLGDLLFGMEAACILAGELYDVETFTQPAVEWGKRAAQGLLGDGSTPEADAVAGKHRFLVE